ncbi:DUF4019 domain-containing protein [Massilia horti]|uniref:DUF4019 domain-containing protein n=1 Tax=Massilia horti TaxID=2562153 RepID=A0A4Y9T7U1_9BURK|nr:DUF4019 domain-containing protein [Massilia horti]TFW34812.1 DUF4019 domain-containing protein [Massilia horti]
MKWVALSLAVALAAAPMVQAQEGLKTDNAKQVSIDDAKRVADQWLAKADAGDANATWDQSASMFQAAVSKSLWAISLPAARASLGKVIGRQLRTATYTRSLAGAPDGEYVVIQYDTNGEKGHATETVTPMREKDGSWKVSGYYVLP